MKHARHLEIVLFSLAIKIGLWIADVTGVDLGAAMSAVGGELTTSDNNEGLMCYFVDKWRLFGNQGTMNLFTIYLCFSITGNQKYKYLEYSY